jgi:hypothetical protein
MDGWDVVPAQNVILFRDAVTTRHPTARNKNAKEVQSKQTKCFVPVKPDRSTKAGNVKFIIF